MKIKCLLFILCLSLQFVSFAQPGNFISLKQETEILENKKKISNVIEIFYDKTKQTITKHYTKPKDFVSVSNVYGETKIYYPSTNEVYYQQFEQLATTRNLIFYFVNNLTDHLGLADEGFTLLSNITENQYYVTIWKAPAAISGIETVKMVFQNGIPLYAEYKSTKDKVVKKIFYSEYQDLGQFRMPRRITEISYAAKGDSVINRSLFSNIQVNTNSTNSYFNFKIPDNAKPMSLPQK